MGVNQGGFVSLHIHSTFVRVHVWRLRAVVWDASLAPSLLVRIDEIDSVGKAERQRRERCVYLFTAPEDLHYRASRSCQRLFITRSHISTPGVQTVRSVACQDDTALSGKVLLSPRSPSPRLTPDCEAGEARQKERESCLPSRAQESSMAARLMTPSLKVTKELLCTRARLWGLIELSSS